LRGISLLVTKLQFCYAIAQEAPASGLEKPPANGGITKIRPKLVPPAAGLGMRWNETNNMTREEIQSKILIVFKEEFEITNPGLDENLTEKYDFDSIDALELLGEIETLLGSELTRDEKKASMDIRTINQICDYIEQLAKKRSS